MPGLQINDSPNVKVWDSRIIANTCSGEFIIDASPSIWIGDGASNVMGAKVKITNPYGAVIKAYPEGVIFDITPPLTDSYTHAIPTQGGKQQKGIYTIVLQLTDQGNKTYEVIKTVNVCDYSSDNYPCDERIRITANCTSGKVSIAIAEPPTFKGKYAQSRVQEWTIYFPTASGLEPLVTQNSHVSVQLFQGVYRVEGYCCASYNMGDNVFINLNYNAALEKNVKCILDYTCIWPQVKKLNDKINANCSEKDKQAASLMVLETLRLITSAELANKAGEDASEYISDLEELLGCQCTCDCSGSPIVGGEPSTDVVITGCNVEESEEGLTKTYNIDNFEYKVKVDEESQDVLSISDPEQEECIKTQTLSLDLELMYNKFKEAAEEDGEFWTEIINSELEDINATCLGYDLQAWFALSFPEKLQAIINKACASANCTAAIINDEVTQVGTDVRISFNQTAPYSSDIYVDGIFQGNILAGVNSLLIHGFVDGLSHEYIIIPRCNNGSVGTSAIGAFEFTGCPSISPPVVSSNNVNDACPYDLTDLVSTPPAGITVEWHTANNTNAATLVPNPSAVSSGVYYAFAKNADNCFSTSTQVTLVCVEAASCTAPLSLSVAYVTGNNKVSFQSAAFPPPSNSYTVKRKAATAPDVDGSYITLGTPTFNSSSSKWELTDGSAVNNALYTYKAQSNCAGSTPYVLYDFGNLTCPVLTLTPVIDEIGYSFPDIGGQINKYEVALFDSTGTVLIQTLTVNPPFSNPVTGSFTDLAPNTAYRVRVKMFIGTYSKTCPLVATTTTTGDSITGGTSMSLGLTSISGTIVINSVAGRTLRLVNFSTCGYAYASVTVSGGIAPLTSNINSGAPSTSQNVDRFLPAGTYTYSGTFSSSASCTGGASISLI